jgi:6-phosphogluconolactonase
MHLTDPRHPRLHALRALALAACASATVAACGPAGLDSAGDTISSGNGGGNGSISSSSSSGGGSATTYAVGGTVIGVSGSGLVLQDDGGDNLAVSASGAFTFATRLVRGAAYAVTVHTQPSSPAQYCTVTNGTGTMTAANVTSVTVTCRTDGRYAFVSDFVANTVTAFTIDFITGNLALVNSTPSDLKPTAIAVTPNGAFVYTANSGSADIGIYAVNAATGALTAAGSASTGAGSVPSAITVDPSGQFVLATDSAGGTVLVFHINPTTGALTQVPGSPFPTAVVPGIYPVSVAVDPSDQYVFATNQFNPPLGLAGYTFNSSPGSGDLTQFSTWQVATGNSPIWVAVDPLDRFVYVANSTDGTLSGWTIGSGGALTAITGSPFAAGAQTQAIAIDPTGRFLYVTDTTNKQLVAFTIDPTTGVPSVMSGSPFGVGNGAFGMAIDPSGQFLYVANSYDGTISMFTVNPNTGALTAVPGSPRNSGGNYPIAIAIE